MKAFDLKKYLAEGRLFEETSLIDHYYIKCGILCITLEILTTRYTGLMLMETKPQFNSQT